MNKNASVGIPMKKICGRLTRILCTYNPQIQMFDGF